jgi:D-alanyl-D-alanine carboxypeptidase (penicillin-binding protein 5/6)
LIGAYAVKNEEFVKIVTTSSYTFQDLTGKRNISVSNKDAFLTMDNEAVGIKTGFTGNAGYCFVGAVKSEGRLFVSCVLACGWPPNKTYKWHDTKILMKLGKENYNYKTVLEENKLLQVSIADGTKESITAQIEGGSEMLLSESDEIEIKTSFNHQLPIKNNETIGKVEIYVNNQKIKENNIVSKESVGKYDFWYCLKKTATYFLL